MVSPENAVKKEVIAEQKQKWQWSGNEISAVMRHFRKHTEKGKLATKIECQRRKTAEHPVLANCCLQNTIDFVRDLGITQKNEIKNKNYIICRTVPFGVARISVFQNVTFNVSMFNAVKHCECSDLMFIWSNNRQ